MDSNEMILRKLLWLRHGCPSHVLYGDDGELQCSACMIDFLRDSAEQIEKRFFEIGMKEYMKSQKKGGRK